MKNSIIRLTLLVLALSAMFLVLSGCSRSSSSENTSSAKAENIKTPEKVIIGAVNSKTLAPQLVYGFQKEIYKEKFPDVNFELDLSKGHTDVAAKLAESKWDLAYLGTGPAIEFSNYGFQNSPPAEYTILAGAQFGPNVLVAKPDIKTLEELDGKAVGITNKNHDKEMVLNKLLGAAGLKTEPLGGTVGVQYGMQGMLFEAFQQGKIQAFYPLPSMVDVLLGQGNIILSDGTELGGKQVFTVFAVSNKFLSQYPDFVKEMLRIHVNTTDLANKDFDEMVKLTYELEMDFFKDDPKRVIEKDELEKLYRQLETTYDPNIAYLEESHKLVADAGYLISLPPFDKWVDLTMLNEVIKEEGLPAVENTSN